MANVLDEDAELRKRICDKFARSLQCELVGTLVKILNKQKKYKACFPNRDSHQMCIMRIDAFSRVKASEQPMIETFNQKVKNLHCEWLDWAYQQERATVYYHFQRIVDCAFEIQANRTA